MKKNFQSINEVLTLKKIVHLIGVIDRGFYMSRTTACSHLPPTLFSLEAVVILLFGVSTVPLVLRRASVDPLTGFTTVLRAFIATIPGGLEIPLRIYGGRLCAWLFPGLSRVESAIRDARDLGYLVTPVTDACLTCTQERCDHSVRTIKGYFRQVSAKELTAGSA